MREVRLAAAGEVERQKEIWKLCFGDSGPYIEDFYRFRYRPDQTMLMLEEGDIRAMVTMLPVGMTDAAGRRLEGAMLYAFATHPGHRNQGLGRQLADCANQYLGRRGLGFSVLVPARPQLFDYYYALGYQPTLYLRELELKRPDLYHLAPPALGRCAISPISPEEYNRRRERLLAGRPHISYSVPDLVNQQRVCRLSGQDIYGISLEGEEGCAVVESGPGCRLAVKELLVAEELVPEVILHLRRLALEQYCTIRMPAFYDHTCGGSVRPFGLIKMLPGADRGAAGMDDVYLGLAFD